MKDTFLSISWALFGLLLLLTQPHCYVELRPLPTSCQTDNDCPAVQRCVPWPTSSCVDRKQATDGGENPDEQIVPTKESQMIPEQHGDFPPQVTPEQRGDSPPILMDRDPIDSEPEASQEPTPEQDANPCQPEVCDGKDNDCDGEIDEDDPALGSACSSGSKGECNGGKIQCKNGVLSCIPLKTPVPEICDGKDNNCNGTIDENNPEGGSCTTGQKGECSAGSKKCLGGRLTCEAPSKPSSETCDGKDNDCDGKIDNNIPAKTCYITASKVCFKGATICSRGRTACDNAKAFTCSSNSNCSGCPSGYKCTSIGGSPRGCANL